MHTYCNSLVHPSTVFCREDVPRLQVRVDEAICRLEAYLPANEMDFKVHIWTHLPEQVQQFGERGARVGPGWGRGGTGLWPSGWGLGGDGFGAGWGRGGGGVGPWLVGPGWGRGGGRVQGCGLLVAACGRDQAPNRLVVLTHNLYPFPCRTPTPTRAGPLYLYSMFGPESFWGDLARRALNKRDAENTMTHAVDDKEACTQAELDNPRHFLVHDVKGQVKIEDDLYSPDVYLRMDVSPKPVGAGKVAALSANDLDMLVYFYCQQLGEVGEGEGRTYEDLWGEACDAYMHPDGGGGISKLNAKDKATWLKKQTIPRSSLRAVREYWGKHYLTIHGTMSAKELSMVRALQVNARFYNRVEIGKLVLRAESARHNAASSSCFLAANHDPVGNKKTMHFGQVERIFEHLGPDNERRVVLRVRWYKASQKFDWLLCTPVVPNVPDRNFDHARMWRCEDVVQWHCFMAPHPLPGRGAEQVVLARHWHVLRAAGYPCAGPI